MMTDLCKGLVNPCPIAANLFTAPLTPRVLDPNNPIVTQKTERTKRQQADVLKLKQIDYKALSETIINI